MKNAACAIGAAGGSDGRLGRSCLADRAGFDITTSFRTPPQQRPKGRPWAQLSRSAASGWRRRSTASSSRRRESSVVAKASSQQPTSMGRVVLVTGVCRDLGGRFARQIATEPGVDRVIGVDVVPPRSDLGDVRFVRADIRNPVIAKVIAAEDVDTVVHLSVIATPSGVGGRTSMKEINVIGTMQLLAACQKAPGVKRLVVKSSSRVYGSSPRDPAMFSEEMAPKRMPRLRIRQGLGRSRGLRPRIRAAQTRCDRDDAALCEPARAQDRDQSDPVLRAPGDSDRGRLRRQAPVSARRRRAVRP